MLFYNHSKHRERKTCQLTFISVLHTTWYIGATFGVQQKSKRVLVHVSCTRYGFKSPMPSIRTECNTLQIRVRRGFRSTCSIGPEYCTHSTSYDLDRRQWMISEELLKFKGGTKKGKLELLSNQPIKNTWWTVQHHAWRFLSFHDSCMIYSNKWEFVFSFLFFL